VCLTLIHMASEITEQYLKVIYNLTESGGAAKTTDMANALHVAPASVTQMLHKLDRDGYVRHEPYRGTVLRPKGRRIARRVSRRHRLLERFLSDVVGVKEDVGHEQACKMEHALGKEAEETLCRMLSHPSHCPHGKKIPKCERADGCKKCMGEGVKLSDLEEGRQAVISHLVSKDKEELCRILAMGFVPGAPLRIEKKMPMGGPIIVDLNGTRIAIARNIGDALHVTRHGSG
jgi:DtxR family Mn-dependent transcriptional regulator